MLSVNATTWTVNVSDFQFSPSTLNVVVGDVIKWVWVNGSVSHTTTSLTVPIGASTWDVLLNGSNLNYSYTATTAGSYTYQCDLHPLLMQASFTVSAAVPVILSSFYTTNVNERPVLKWTTASEVNADYFSVRRSDNGKNFREIGRVPANGNSSTEKKYSDADETLASGTRYVYYTLAIVDKDGKSQLSPIKIFKNRSAATKLITSLSPNPISGPGHLMLQFNADRPGTMFAKLFDMQGKIILSTNLSALKGINNGHIHLGDIPAGNYTIRFNLNGVSESYQVRRE
jgi:plastocyanin